MSWSRGIPDLSDSKNNRASNLAPSLSCDVVLLVEVLLHVAVLPEPFLSCADVVQRSLDFAVAERLPSAVHEDSPLYVSRFIAHLASMFTVTPTIADRSEGLNFFHFSFFHFLNFVFIFEFCFHFFIFSFFHFFFHSHVFIFLFFHFVIFPSPEGPLAPPGPSKNIAFS